MEKKKLTTAAGAPVADNQNVATAGRRGPMLLRDVWFLEKLAHFDREVIPERRMHAKGSGAFGKFTVTHDITPYTKASVFSQIGKETEIYIADTIGEMGLWYSLCPIVFIGGSLIPHGGQNFMEPSRMKKAVMVGPYMHNFTDAMNRAKKADAIIQVSDADELKDMVIQLLTDKDLLEAKMSLAYNWANSENKVLDGILEKVKGYMQE